MLISLLCSFSLARATSQSPSFIRCEITMFGLAEQGPHCPSGTALFLLLTKGRLGAHFTGGAYMLRNAIWITLFGLIVGGCASDRTMESSSDSSSAGGGAATMSSPTTTSPTASHPTMSSTPRAEANSMNQSTSAASKGRIAAGVEEETLDSCVARIPQDATVGQRMLAEQTCRRDFSRR